MKKQYAFLLMGEHYDPDTHRCRFETESDIVHLRTVRNFEEAKKTVLLLKKDGIGAIELCGAFGPEKARELTELTDNETAIGYVVHDTSLDSVFTRFFGSP